MPSAGTKILGAAAKVQAFEREVFGVFDMICGRETLPKTAVLWKAFDRNGSDKS